MSDMPRDSAEALMLSVLAQSTEDADVPKVQQQISVMLSPWYRDFIRYNPATDIKAVHKPWLAINGDLDCQVLPGNLNTIKSLNSSVETVLLPHHNHLFQECTTGTLDEYAKIPSSISPQTLETMSEWLDKTISTKSGTKNP
jgi:hypothetical protein